MFSFSYLLQLAARMRDQIKTQEHGHMGYCLKSSLFNKEKKDEYNGLIILYFCECLDGEVSINLTKFTASHTLTYNTYTNRDHFNTHISYYC